MNTPEDKQELRLRELETEIYQNQKLPEAEINLSEPLLCRTSKHNPPKGLIQKLTKKIVKYAKFTVFVVFGIAVIRVGFLVGMWITYLALASIIAAIGYQIFLREDD